MADDDAITSLNEHIESLNEYNTALVTQYNVLAGQYDSVIALNETLKGPHSGGLLEDVRRHHLPFLVTSGILAAALLVLFIICMRMNSNLKGFGEKLLVVEKDKEKLYKNFTDLKAETENLRQELRDTETEKKELELANADLAKRLEEAMPESDKETKSYQLTYSEQTPVYTELSAEPRKTPPKTQPPL
jgi:chromosome segregation ATPase